MSKQYQPAHDLLGLSAPLAEQLDVAIFGIPVRYRSNSSVVIAQVERALTVWRSLPPELVEPGPPAIVDLVVHPIGPGDPAVSTRGRLIFRAHGDTFLAADGGSILMAQLAGGRAMGFLTPELLDDEANLRHNVIECLGFLLANDRDRTPIHAAGIARDGRAILLAGPSTAGKSTLCYAAVRAGFDLLSEDTVCVSLAGRRRIWGHPGPIHLLPDAPRLFPELAGLPPRVRANGKIKLAVELPAAGTGRCITHADSAVVCFVERGPGQGSTLRRVDSARALAALADPRESGFDLFAARAPAVAEVLVEGGAYCLTVGSDLSQAVALLARLAETQGEL